MENGGVYQSAIVNQNEQTPEESIEVASKQLKESLKDELLDKIKKIPQDFLNNSLSIF